MREAIRVICVVIFMFAAPTAAIVWTDEQPGPIVWVLRIGCPILCVLAIAVFLRVHLRADVVPDYLRQHVGSYFNRGGFCFGFTTAAADGICYLQAHFQNQQDQPCVGRIALRPARGFFLGRANIETITFEVNCEPGAFGIAKIPIPLPEKLQGKRQSFEVGASVDYPHGKGRTLRFRDGLLLRANSNFGNAFGTALTVAGALTGQIVLSRPATATILLPAGVREDVAKDLAPEIKTLWRLGDPPVKRLPAQRSDQPEQKLPGE